MMGYKIIKLLKMLVISAIIFFLYRVYREYKLELLIEERRPQLERAYLETHIGFIHKIIDSQFQTKKMSKDLSMKRRILECVKPLKESVGEFRDWIKETQRILKILQKLGRNESTLLIYQLYISQIKSVILKKIESVHQEMRKVGLVDRHRSFRMQLKPVHILKLAHFNWRAELIRNFSNSSWVESEHSAFLREASDVELHRLQKQLELTLFDFLPNDDDREETFLDPYIRDFPISWSNLMWNALGYATEWEFKRVYQSQTIWEEIERIEQPGTDVFERSRYQLSAKIFFMDLHLINRHKEFRELNSLMKNESNNLLGLALQM